jgi:hypothetical protein
MYASLSGLLDYIQFIRNFYFFIGLHPILMYASLSGLLDYIQFISSPERAAYIRIGCSPIKK